MAAREAAINPLRRRLGGALRSTLVATLGRATVAGRAWPDVVVLGAQRCGTTSLWRWLTGHPDFVAPVLGMKGVHYFDLAADRPAAWYRAHFPLRRSLGEDGRTGEASPYYLFHPRVPAHAAAVLPPSTRFVVLLRDPVRRAVSHYHHMRDEGTEPLPTLEAALDAEPARLAGATQALLADRGARHEHHLHHGYAARGEYADQLARWFAHVDRERFLVLDAGRLRDDAAGLLAEVCQFVGLDPAAAPAPDRGVNAGRYEQPDPATVARLRAHFSDHDARLWDLLGEQWW